jgi:sulfatase modifying factor 1
VPTTHVNWLAPTAATLLTASALAQVDPASGIDFVTVGAIGNAPWQGNGTPGDRAIGRGTVNYEYRIGKYEVKSNEWAEFFTAALDRPAGDEIPHVSLPAFTGMFGTTPQNTQNPNAQAFTTTPDSAWRGSGGITWRTAAIYCNWLHNGKATNRDAFLSGAYDVSTFGFAQPFGFSDQRERSPGAKYSIPSWDEWLKAAHYDPSKQNGDGTVGGWWSRANMRDTSLTYGPPPSFGGDGTGMANSGFSLPGFVELTIPLNSYPTQQTAWGLIDAAGMTTEWTEESLITAGQLVGRLADGSYWTSSGGSASVLDRITASSGDDPDLNSLRNGFRIAAVIPSPSVVATAGIAFSLFMRRRRLGGSEGSPRSISKRRHAIAASALVAASLAPSALAQVDPATGIDFVTVGAAGNSPWAGNGDPDDQAVGRGGVNYEYRIGRYEVTTANWVEFMNAAWDRPVSDRIPFVGQPAFWGAAGTTPNTPGGFRWTVPAGSELRMVSGVSWRTAAIYCNWLHNGKSLDRAAFLSGAYDVSTFGTATPFGFTDQLERSPGAKYFLPTWDEWLKASHYDPNKQNSDGTLGGWWQYANMRDTPLTYGPPPSFGGDGTGMANAGFTLPGFAELLTPLGSYSTQQSPWSLLDTAGGTIEWTESARIGSGIPQSRIIDGSYFGSSPGAADAADKLGIRGSEFPSIAFLDFGFRVASVVPSPSGVAVGVVALVFSGRRRHGGSHEKAVSFPLRTDDRV